MLMCCRESRHARLQLTCRNEGEATSGNERGRPEQQHISLLSIQTVNEPMVGRIQTHRRIIGLKRRCIAHHHLARPATSEQRTSRSVRRNQAAAISTNAKPSLRAAMATAPLLNPTVACLADVELEPHGHRGSHCSNPAAVLAIVSSAQTRADSPSKLASANFSAKSAPCFSVKATMALTVMPL
jgi:hypothetical protein